MLVMIHLLWYSTYNTTEWDVTIEREDINKVFFIMLSETDNNNWSLSGVE